MRSNRIEGFQEQVISHSKVYLQIWIIYEPHTIANHQAFISTHYIGRLNSESGRGVDRHESLSYTTSLSSGWYSSASALSLPILLRIHTTGMGFYYQSSPGDPLM